MLPRAPTSWQAAPLATAPSPHSTLGLPTYRSAERARRVSTSSALTRMTARLARPASSVAVTMQYVSGCLARHGPGTAASTCLLAVLSGIRWACPLEHTASLMQHCRIASRAVKVLNAPLRLDVQLAWPALPANSRLRRAQLLVKHARQTRTAAQKAPS
jgi:hypothetical protein